MRSSARTQMLRLPEPSGKAGPSDPLAQLQLPLPGGEPEACVRVTGLLSATMVGPGDWFFRSSSALPALGALGLRGRAREMHRFPIAAFLVEHPGAGEILIDTGLSAAALAAPARELGRIGTTVFRDLRGSEPGGIAAQLQQHGARPRLVVMTHLHWDHASGIQELPDAQILLTPEEWLVGHRWLASLHGYRTRQLRRARSVRFLDFHGPHGVPWESFRRSIDLFGDGSVRLLFTPGHSPGHVSILLRLRNRLALLAGDALYTLRTLFEEHHPWQLGDPRRYGESFASIATFARAHPDALVLPGHDLDAWESSGIEAGI